MMDRVVITKSWAGLAGMQVCVIADATDEEILDVCNRLNPAGISGGWSEVVRTINTDAPGIFDTQGMLPKQCEDHADRMHYLVTC